MSVWVNRNLGGKWQKVEVEGSEVLAVFKENYDRNLGMVKNIVKAVKRDLNDFPKEQKLSFGTVERLAVLLAEKNVTPLHYAIENFVDSKLANGAKKAADDM